MMEFEKVQLNEKSQNRKRLLVSLVAILLVAILAVSTALVVKFYVISTYYVNGESMLPTLNGGDDSVQKDGDLLYLNKLARIKRGDIIVFTPDWIDDGNGNFRSLVKRVIGVGGDTVEIKSNEVFVNGDKLDEPYIKEPMQTPDLVVSVPNGFLFCLGDNRNNSSDSRTFGCVDLDDVVGKCFLIKRASGSKKFSTP